MSEQQLPVPNDRPHIVDLVVDDLRKRREVGIERYGTALQAFNGRSALRDLYEEILDAAQYLRQRIEEDNGTPELREFAAQQFDDFAEYWFAKGDVSHHTMHVVNSAKKWAKGLRNED